MDQTLAVHPLLNIVIALLALLLHLFLAWGNHRETVEKVGFGAYVALWPARTAIALTASTLAFLGAYAMGWLNPMVSLACGYMGVDIVKRMAERGSAAIK